MLHGGQLWAQLRYEACQIQIKHQDLVLCMVDDVLQVCQKEPWVQGVTHSPQSHDAIPAQAVACHLLCKQARYQTSLPNHMMVAGHTVLVHAVC